MGYRGKLAEQEQARQLRAMGWTLADIAEKLGVAKSSVSLWVRDVAFEPSPRRTGARLRPNALQRPRQRRSSGCWPKDASESGGSTSASYSWPERPYTQGRAPSERAP